MSLRLSRTEVKELCGTPIRAKQCAFLRLNGIPHYLEEDGTPVVLRAKAGTDKAEAECLDAAQKLLGHKQQSTTQHYIKKRLGSKSTPTR